MKKSLVLFTLSLGLLASCGGSSTSSSSTPASSFQPSPVETKTITKEEYRNKTLGGLLGQMAGFLSGYEFVWDGPLPRLCLPESWFEFCYGPYAGNFNHYDPGGNPPETNSYNRLKNTGLQGEKEIASDDDYHLDLFAQTIIDEYGTSSKDIADAWYDYKIYDWGGGHDAMSLINKNKMLAPHTGTIESGNRYGWCTEAYIENETLGMDAGGMPNVAVNLADTFASNVGYYDALIWGKFYAACYSIAYFEDDVATILEKAKQVLPQGSYPRTMYELAKKTYEENKNDIATAAQIIADARRNLYRIDNIQTDPNVNGGFTILSLLYGENDYMNTCKWSSLIGYDGDCTAATATGLLGIIKGFKEGNPEYQTINDSFYHYGEGTYYNEQSYTTHIGNVDKYGLHIKIDHFVDLYVKNFEKILLRNGGSIDDTYYHIPVSDPNPDRSICFKNNDAEGRNCDNWSTSGGGIFTNVEDTSLDYGHAGSFCFKMENASQTSAYHHYDNLRVGSYYRVSTYAKTNAQAIGMIFAKDENGKEQSSSFVNCTNLLNKKLVFQATSPSMDIGIKFGLASKAGDVLYFDDFFVEEIDYEVVGAIPSSTMTMNTGSVTKALQKPENYVDGDEVMIRITYAQKSGGTLQVGVLRNNETYGTVLASNSGYSLTTLTDVMEIPYVFAKSTDYLKLTFDGQKIAIGNIDIVKKTSYAFR